MHMSYFFSSTVYDFLFQGANITTTWGMVSLCLGLLCLSVLMEGFKVGRSQLLKVAWSRRLGSSRYSKSERIKFHVMQSFLHIVHLTIGYMLMLAVMTYNAYFTIAVVGGAGVGYYFLALFDLPGKLLGISTPSPAKAVSTPGVEVLLGNSSDKPATVLHCTKYGLCSDESNKHFEEKVPEGENAL